MKKSPILLLLIALFFTACSSKKEKNNEYTLARDESWSPLNLMGKTNNLLAFSDDLIYQISEKEGFEVDFDNVFGNTLLHGLDDGTYDGIITFKRPDSFHSSRYAFSSPFFLLGPVLVVREDSNIVSIADLKNQVVGIQSGANVSFQMAKTPQIIFSPYEDILVALRNLANGRIDGVILETVPAYEYTNSYYEGILRVVPPPLTDDGLRIMTLKTNKGLKLIEMFNRGLLEMLENGEYHAIVKKWRLTNAAKDYAETVAPNQ